VVLGEASFQLVTLTCITESAQVKTAGFAAIRSSAQERDEARERLLTALATHLLDTSASAKAQAGR
jgi:hypothetical protein